MLYVNIHCYLYFLCKITGASQYIQIERSNYLDFLKISPKSRNQWAQLSLFQNLRGQFDSLHPTKRTPESGAEQIAHSAVYEVK